MSSSGYPALTLASCMAREIAFFWSVVLPALIVTVNNGIRALPIMKGRGTNPGQSESLYQRNDPTLHNLACYLCLAGYDSRAASRLLLAFSNNADGFMKI